MVSTQARYTSCCCFSSLVYSKGIIYEISPLLTIIFLSLGITFLGTPPNQVHAQLGCETITYNGTGSNNIDNSIWGWSYCFNGNADDVLNISMVATSGDLDTYLELSDSNGTVLESNDDADKTSSNSLIQFKLPTTGAYSIYAGRYDVDSGKTTGTFLLTLSTTTGGSTQPGRPTSNTTTPTVTATPTNVCNNVAVSMDFIGAAFDVPTNQPLALLDDNSTTGWSTNSATDEFWFDVVLNGMQTITSIEFNGFAPSGIPANSINIFTISRWVAETEMFEDILEITAPMQPGYQTYTFPPVTTESLTFFLTTNHGGATFEVADIKVCTDAVGTNNTVGRPTANTTNQTQPVAPSVPCTVSVSGIDAELRVGPGKNRSIVLYLSAGDTFVVIGTANADDGTRWWRLDKTKTAPAKAAQINETWVSAAQMTESGDCDAVGTVAAPRIIRARPTAAPRPTTVSGGSSSGGNTSATPQPTPQEGSTEPYIDFYASLYYLFEGECTTLSWDVRNVKEIYFIDDTGSEKAVTGPTGSETVCPQVPTGRTTYLTYELRVVPLSGNDIYSYIEIEVDANFICITPYPSFTEFGTISFGEVHTYSVFVDPSCGDSVNAPAATVYISILKDSGDLDPYMEVYTNGSFYGSDDDGGQNLDSFMELGISSPTDIQIDVSNLFGDGTGEYTIDVYIEAFNG